MARFYCVTYYTDGLRNKQHYQAAAISWHSFTEQWQTMLQLVMDCTVLHCAWCYRAYKVPRVPTNPNLSPALQQIIDNCFSLNFNLLRVYLHVKGHLTEFINGSNIIVQYSHLLFTCSGLLVILTFTQGCYKCKTVQRKKKLSPSTTSHSASPSSPLEKSTKRPLCESTETRVMLLYMVVFSRCHTTGHARALSCPAWAGSFSPLTLS